MIALVDHRWRRLAAIGVLVAALGLCACGRKGPLDPPPVSAAPVQTVEGAAAPNSPPAGPEVVPGFPGAQDASQQPTIGRDGGGAPMAPPPSGRPQQRFFLDWLLD